jgi:HemY protein
MIRVLFFVLVVFALGLGFAWLADRPGELVVTFGGYQYRVTLMVAAVVVTAIVASVMILWWLVKAIWNSPYTVARYFRVRRRDRGYQALSTGMIAAGVGDGALARRMNRQASKLISSDQEPLIHLLDAQASLLEGDHEAARAKFKAMLDDPEMRVLGLRGLYLEAERLGERGVARHYAEQAAEVAPQLGWASNATIEAKTAEGDWDAALRLLDAQRSSRQVEPHSVNRRRAVLLTAKAMSLLSTDPLAAKNIAVEANRLAPDLVPAAVTAAKALFAQGDVRKGAKILEAAWKKTPHPEVAETYVHARPGDSTHDRLKRARKLQALKQNHPESALAVARAALAAGEFGEAREAAESAVRMAPRESAYLLMADIEEAETGDIGRVRQLLAKAVRAARDPTWTADGYVSDRWAPISPMTGRLDAFEWRVPVERLGQLIEQDGEEPAIGEIPALPMPAEVTAPPADTDEGVGETVVPPAPHSAAPAPVAASSAAATEVGETPPPPAAPAPAAPERGGTDDAKDRRETIAPPIARRPAEPTETRGRGERLDKPRLLQIPQPDDPGVEPEDEQEEGEARRFRLF